MDEKGFNALLSGRFDGMVRLQDVDQLKEKITATNGWYVVDPGDSTSNNTPVDGIEARQQLDTMVEEILTEERGIWTTMIYANTIEDPLLIKVFHPRRAGCGCGPSMGIVPWRVFSRVEPELVPEWQPKESCRLPDNSDKTGEQPWWKKMF
ncbi:MAG: hypothetical protein HQL54_06705 [Magnetococcales bacterium]|nr:hypothetical protein [Magnetococcales bacterium]